MAGVVVSDALVPGLVGGFSGVGLAAGPGGPSAPIPMPQKSSFRSASPARESGASTGGYTHVGTPAEVDAHLHSKAAEVAHLRAASAEGTLGFVMHAHGVGGSEGTVLGKPPVDSYRLIGQGTSGFVLQGPDSFVMKYVPLSQDSELETQVTYQINDEAAAFKLAYPGLASFVLVSTGTVEGWDKEGAAGLSKDFYRPWCEFLERSRAGNWAEWKKLDNPTFVRLVLPHFPGCSLDQAHADIFQITPESGKKRWRSSAEVESLNLLIPRAYEIAQGLLAGVLQIHKARVVHGDLKPANIVFDPKTSKLNIVDFGSARFSKMTVSDEHSTPPTLVFAPPGARKGVGDLFIERLWDFDLDYYSSAILISSFLFHPVHIQLKFERTPQWYLNREIKLKELLNKMWDELENPASGLTPEVIPQGKFLIHAISQLLCLIKTPENLRGFLGQTLDDFNHKPLYLRAASFYLESIPEIEKVQRTATNLYDEYKKHQEAKKAEASFAGIGAGSSGSGESLSGDPRGEGLAEPLLGPAAASDFSDPVAYALFEALCPIKTSCFCFHKLDLRGYQLPEEISSFERRCLEGFVEAAPSVSKPSPVRESKTSTSTPGLDAHTAADREETRRRADSNSGRSEGGVSLPGVHPAGQSKEG